MAGAFIPKVLIARTCRAADKAGHRFIASACGAEVEPRHGRSPLHAGGRPGKERVARYERSSDWGRGAAGSPDPEHIKTADPLKKKLILVFIGR